MGTFSAIYGVIKERYSSISQSTVLPYRINIYSSLTSVGFSIIIAALGLFSMTLVLFSPTFSFLSLGKVEKVALGMFTSVAAIKVYKTLKILNSAILRVGQDTFGRNQFWEPSTTLIRISYIALNLIFCTISAITTYYIFSNLGSIEDIFPKLGNVVYLMMLLSSLVSLLGLVLVFVGSLLVSWALSRPFRNFLVSVYRLTRFKLTEKSLKLVEYITGVSIYISPDLLCDACYNEKFLLIRGETVKEGETDEVIFDIVCSNCSDIYGTCNISEVKNRFSESHECQGYKTMRIHVDSKSYSTFPRQ